MKKFSVSTHFKSLLNLLNPSPVAMYKSFPVREDTPEYCSKTPLPITAAHIVSLSRPFALEIVSLE